MKKSNLENKDDRLYNRNFIDACHNAVNGIVYCATTQTNIKKQLLLGTIVMILSLFYNFTTAEFLCLTFAVFFVIFSEMINTAIETMVDLMVDVFHPKAKIAKDVGAGAVVLAAINAIIVAYFLFFREGRLTQISDSIFSQMVSSPSHLAFVAIILTAIAVLVAKAEVKAKEMITGRKSRFIPSGQSALAFAILTAIWINSRDPLIVSMALALSILIVGNRMNDSRTFAETLFGSFMGVLIVVLVYGLTIFQMGQ